MDEIDKFIAACRADPYADYHIDNVNPLLPDWEPLRIRKGRGVAGHLPHRGTKTHATGRRPFVFSCSVSPATYRNLTSHCGAMSRGRAGGKSSYQVKGAPYGACYIVNVEAVQYAKALLRWLGREDLRITPASVLARPEHFRGTDGPVVIDHFVAQRYGLPLYTDSRTLSIFVASDWKNTFNL